MLSLRNTELTHIWKSNALIDSTLPSPARVPPPRPLHVHYCESEPGATCSRPAVFGVNGEPWLVPCPLLQLSLNPNAGYILPPKTVPYLAQRVEEKVSHLLWKRMVGLDLRSFFAFQKRRADWMVYNGDKMIPNVCKPNDLTLNCSRHFVIAQYWICWCFPLSQGVSNKLMKGPWATPLRQLLDLDNPSQQLWSCYQDLSLTRPEPSLTHPIQGSYASHMHWPIGLTKRPVLTGPLGRVQVVRERTVTVAETS